jgi:hypothetical protein
MNAFVVSGLIKRRAELAGEIGNCEVGRILKAPAGAERVSPSRSPAGTGKTA